MAIDIDSLSPSRYVSSGNTLAAINTIVPTWLQFISEKIITTAKAVAPRFGSASRKFWYHVISYGSSHIALIYCRGPRVEISAWDLIFTVPAGGFKYGDKDPVTGESFPGGINSRGSFVTLEDKPETAGENVRHRARTYSQYSGRTINKKGFFDEALRVNIGHDAVLSKIGRKNLQLLGYELGKEYARGIGEQVKREGTAAGFIVTVGPVQTVTIEG